MIRILLKHWNIFYKNIYAYFDFLINVLISVLINKKKEIILSSIFCHLIFYSITFDDVLVFEIF